MTIDSGRFLSIRKLSYLSWLITPCCGWTDCQEWICFYKHPVSVLHLTDVLGMNFSCLDLLCLKKTTTLKHVCWSWDFHFSSLNRGAVFGLHAWITCIFVDIWSFSLILMSDEMTGVTIASILFCRFMGKSVIVQVKGSMKAVHTQKRKLLKRNNDNFKRERLRDCKCESAETK